MTDRGVPPPKLPRNPFRLRIAPENAIAHKGWRRAGEQALARLLVGPGLVVVLGEPGTGKTLLLRDLQRRLLALGHEARLVTPGDAWLDPEFEPAAHRAGKRFMMIDGAGAGGSMLAAASLVPDMRCILAEHPGFETQFSALAQQPTIVRLAPLRPKEARAFIAARIAQAAGPPNLLTPDALGRLVKASGGVPRSLCVLGATALHFARAEASPQVTGEHVARALAMSVLPPHTHGPDAAASGAMTVPLATSPPPSADLAPVAPTPSPRVGAALVRDGLSAPRRRWAAALAILVLAGAAWSVVRRDRPSVDATPPSNAPAAAAIQASGSRTVAERTDQVPPQPAPDDRPALSSPAPLTNATAAGDGESQVQGSTPARGVSQPTFAPGGDGPVPPSMPATAALEHPTISPAADPALIGPASVTTEAATPPTPTHIVISYPRGDQESKDPGDSDSVPEPVPGAALAGRLRQAGYLVGDPVPVARTFVTPGLYAYFAEDVAAAEELHAALGPTAPEVELIELPPGSSLPRPGTLEITAPPGALVEEWSKAVMASGARLALEPAPAAGAAQATAPADNATITIGPVGSVALEWTEPVEHALYFVEVRAVDGAPHEVFAAYADHGPLEVALDPASRHYAWRIYTVEDTGGHYRLGRWAHFTVLPAEQPPGSSAALPSREAGP